MRFCARSGVNGFMVLGTTGEFPHLEVPIRKRVLEVAKANANGLPVLANISDIRPRVVQEMGKFCKELQVDAVSLLPPYYYPLAPSDLREFFLQAAAAADRPVFLYNFPERVGYKIPLEVIEAVADRVPMLGIKQSGADFDYHHELVALGRKKNFVVITGSDTALPEALPIGVTGVVSGLSNAVADLVVKTYQEVRAGKTRNEIPSAGMLNTLAGKLGALEFPFNIGAMVQARGLPVGHPKMWVSEETRQKMAQLTEAYRALFQQWNLL